MATRKLTATKKEAETAEEMSRPAAKQFRFGFLVHDVSRMRRTLFDQVMKPLGITRSQWSVLAWLSRGGNQGVMQVDLARQLDVGKVTIGGLIDRLESSGYIERRADANDRRVRRVFITDKGYDTIRAMENVGAQNNRNILIGISPEDLRITEATLAKVKANIRDQLTTASLRAKVDPKDEIDLD